MANPFYVWTTFSGAKSACGYYRIEVPLRSLEQAKFAEVYYDEGKHTKDSQLALLYSDVALFYSLSGAPFLHQVKTLRGIRPGQRGDIKLHPPTLIYDADDNTDFVHPFNTTYAHLGVRDYPDGRLLRPGEALAFTDDSGKEHIAWEDGVSRYEDIIFNIANNLKELKIRHEAIRLCHGATVTSKPLATYYQEVLGQKNVHIYPNTVVIDDYDQIPVVRTDQKIRILWQGSQSHYIDWWPLRFAVKELAEKYKDKVTFVIWGQWFDWIHDIIPDSMVEHHFWTPYEAYKLKRGLLNCDINLCPLADNAFNACKSAIKWYEASIWDSPEATLAANTITYSEIKDGKTGLLYNNPQEFIDKLSLLIENADLRKKLAHNAKEWVLTNRTPENTTSALFDFYVETRSRQKREQGNPIIAPSTVEEMKNILTALR